MTPHAEEPELILSGGNIVGLRTSTFASSHHNDQLGAIYSVDWDVEGLLLNG